MALDWTTLGAPPAAFRAKCRVVGWAVLVAGASAGLLGCSGRTGGGSAAVVDQAAEPTVVVFEAPPILEGETDRIKHDFIVVNPTDRPLEIVRMERSCTCTETEMAVRRLLPGEETTLHVETDIRNRTGRVQVHVTLVPEAGALLMYQLNMRVYERVRFETAILSLGTIEPGEEIARRFTVVTSSRDPTPPLPVLTLDAPERPLELRQVADESEEQPDDGIAVRRTTWDLRLGPQVTPGKNRVEVVARCPGQGLPVVERRMPIQWGVRERYAVDPPRLFFAGLKGQASGGNVFPISVRRLDGKP